MEADKVRGEGSILDPGSERDIEQELEQGGIEEKERPGLPKYVFDDRYATGFPDYVCDVVKSGDEEKTGYEGHWNIPG